MASPWEVLDRVRTSEGDLELRHRAGGEYLITIGGRILMNSALHRTEVAVAEMACQRVADRQRPRVLIGGLGMGYSLRAALDALPPAAAVVVAEIQPEVVEWCRGPIAHLSGDATGDRRVRILVEDVRRPIADAARLGGPARFDALVLDLYEGPRTAAGGDRDPMWGTEALGRVHGALNPGGVLAVWSEDADPGFDKRLMRCGFDVRRTRPGKGGPRHVVYLATPGRRTGRKRR